jgi:hypothetical protein
MAKKVAPKPVSKLTSSKSMPTQMKSGGKMGTKKSKC